MLEELELTDKAMSFVAEYGALGNQRDMVAAAWDLGAVEQHYEEFIAEFAYLFPQTPDETLIAQIRLVHEWRRFPFLDPQLPRLLLPEHWSGTAAKKLFEEKHTAWREIARRRWSELAVVDH